MPNYVAGNWKHKADYTVYTAAKIVGSR